jgi:hypothetical protein
MRTDFSVFGYRMKHSFSCLIYNIKVMVVIDICLVVVFYKGFKMPHVVQTNGKQSIINEQQEYSLFTMFSLEYK